MKKMLCVAVVLLGTACTPVIQPLHQPERYPEPANPVSSTCGVDAHKEPNAHRCLDNQLLLKRKMKRKFKGPVRRREAPNSGSSAVTAFGKVSSSQGARPDGVAPRAVPA